MVSHRIWHILHLFFNMFLFQTVVITKATYDDDGENGSVMILMTKMMMVKMLM